MSTRGENQSRENPDRAHGGAHTDGASGVNRWSASHGTGRHTREQPGDTPSLLFEWPKPRALTTTGADQDGAGTRTRGHRSTHSRPRGRSSARTPGKAGRRLPEHCRDQCPHRNPHAGVYGSSAQNCQNLGETKSSFRDAHTAVRPDHGGHYSALNRRDLSCRGKIWKNLSRTSRRERDNRKRPPAVRSQPCDSRKTQDYGAGQTIRGCQGWGREVWAEHCGV